MFGRRKTPTMLQMEALECGAASLGMILGYYGHFASLEKLRVDCGVSRDGSKASNILKAARAYGLDAKGYRRSVDDLDETSLPAILFWELNHFVVFEGRRGNRYFINDPAYGSRVVSKEALAQSFSGIVLEFEPGTDFAKTGEKPSSWRLALGRVKGSFGAGLFFACLGLALMVLALWSPSFFRVLIDEVFLHGLSSWVVPLVFLATGVAALRGILIASRERAVTRAQLGIGLNLVSTTFWHLLRMPMTFFDQRYVSDLSNRLLGGFAVAQAMPQFLMAFAMMTAALLVLGVVMFTYDPKLALIFAGIVGIGVFFRRLLWQNELYDQRRMASENNKNLAALMGGLINIETLKSMGIESEFFERWAGYQARLVNAEQQVVTKVALGQILAPSLMFVIAAIVLGYGATQISQGVLTSGMLVAFLFLAFLFSEPIGSASSLSGQMQDLDIALRRIDDILNYPLAPEWQTESPKDSFILSGQVSIKSVSFGYDRFKEPVIADLSLDLHPGRRVALVGPNGCGKSSIAKLVCGLYEPISGEIRLDGRLLKDIDRDAFARYVGFVEQDIFIFHGTIRDNLTLWDKTISDEQIVAAAKDAEIHNDIMAMPMGYDSVVLSLGRNLSGGQIERLDLARALCKNPSLLVLDEAMGALDPVTEGRIQGHLRKRGCTQLIVSQRLSAIRDCDEILVLDQGRIVERGDHSQLMALNGRYRQMVEQAG